MEVLLIALFVYAVLSVYVYRDAFFARRDQIEQAVEEPLIAASHIVGSLALFLVAGALITGGVLVAFGGAHMRGVWILNAIATRGALVDLFAGTVSIALGLLLVKFTRDWLASVASGNSEPPKGRTHRIA